MGKSINTPQFRKIIILTQERALGHSERKKRINDRDWGVGEAVNKSE